VRRVLLANGARLLCKANDSSEIVAIVCQVRVGLPDENEDRAGLAAMTAEAMLRGTTTRNRAALSQAIVNAGGDFRAQPGMDFTEFTVVTDRARWEAAAKLLADILAHPSFEADQLEPVRGAIRRRAVGFGEDFTSGSYQEMMSQLYQEGPYGRPIFGTEASLARITVPDLRRFWQANYTGNRITLALVGDVDVARAVPAAERAFEDLPGRAAETPRPLPPDRIDRPRVDLIQKEGNVGQVMAGCLAPPVNASNYPVLAVLEAVVGGGKRSRIGARVREQHSVGYANGSSYQPLLGQSHLIAFLMFPVPPADRAAPVLEQPKHLLIQQLEDLAAAGPTDAEVTRGKAFAIGEHALRHERNRDQAKWLSWSEAAGLGVAMDQDFPGRVAAVTKDQVHEAAKQLFKNYALVITLPPPG
jgi:zinc protease